MLAIVIFTIQILQINSIIYYLPCFFIYHCQKNITEIWSIPIVSESLVEVVPEMHHKKVLKLDHSMFPK